LNTMNKTIRFSSRLLTPTLVILVLLNLALLIGLASAFLFPNAASTSRLTPAGAAAQPMQATPSPSLEPTVQPSHTPEPALSPVALQADPLQQSGIIILSMRDGNYNHLFAYHPQHLPLTRLTEAAWDDIHPALSPDGSLLAYSSRRNGYWDLYVMNLADGSLARITDTPAYDGAPAWSPDGHWLAYESYVDGQLDIFIRSTTDPAQQPIRLTEDPAVDSMPHWSPDGRRIAFVSTRSGEEEIWVANLDQTDDRFFNVSRAIHVRQVAPRWSPDGRYLAWAAEKDGESTLMVWHLQDPSSSAFPIGAGHLPVWSPDGQILLSEIRRPNRVALGGYDVLSRSMRYPASELPASIQGIDWKAGALPNLFRSLTLSEYAHLPAGPLWLPSISIDPTLPHGRQGIAPLKDVSAPYPYLHDAVDESFQALRARVGLETGWDFLSSLEEAYSPLTDPPEPGISENWLFTGRGFAINPMPFHAGWMIIIKEDYLGQTFWRVYLKTRFQDGSQGMPVRRTTWNLNARFSGISSAFEDGGSWQAVPQGYWVDFTELAGRYGWERLPALSNWRAFYPATRFNQFVLTGGLDWHSAMSEVYPPEALITATSVPTPTPTNTRTPFYRPRSTRTPTPTITPTQTATIRPTWTSAP
jgi:TolB protein